MKHMGNPQTNTKVYWNNEYKIPEKAAEYKSFSHRFVEALKYVKDGDKFLDIGCGVAKPAELIRKERKGCEIWGVDISDYVVEENKKLYPDEKYFQGYVGSLDFLPKDYFDVVFCGEVIEHLDDPAVLFKEAYPLLRPKGLLIVTTPRDNKIPSEEHMWTFDREDVKGLFDEAGFKNVSFVDLPDIEHLLIIFAVGEK